MAKEATDVGIRICPQCSKEYKKEQDVHLFCNKKCEKAFEKQFPDKK